MAVDLQKYIGLAKAAAGRFMRSYALRIFPLGYDDLVQYALIEVWQLLSKEPDSAVALINWRVSRKLADRCLRGKKQVPTVPWDAISPDITAPIDYIKSYADLHSGPEQRVMVRQALKDLLTPKARKADAPGHTPRYNEATIARFLMEGDSLVDLADELHVSDTWLWNRREKLKKRAEAFV